MRKILFKGKRIDGQPPYKVGMNDDGHDGWVYGYYVHKGNSQCLGGNDEKHFIYVWRHYDWNLDTLEPIEIDPSTVCEFTGLTDKNGKEIFEADVVRNGYTNHLGEFYKNGVVVYVENDGSFEIANDECYLNRLTRNMVVQRNIEVIGSIHDAPVGKEGM